MFLTKENLHLHLENAIDHSTVKYNSSSKIIQLHVCSVHLLQLEWCHLNKGVSSFLKDNSIFFDMSLRSRQDARFLRWAQSLTVPTTVLYIITTPFLYTCRFVIREITPNAFHSRARRTGIPPQDMIHTWTRIIDVVVWITYYIFHTTTCVKEFLCLN